MAAVAAGADSRRLDALEAELLAGGGGGGAAGRRREYLRLARAQRVRRSEAVATIGAQLLGSPKARAALGEELFVVCEQVCVAACDFNAPALVRQTLGALQEAFPDSMRVGRLEGLALEAEGRFGEAEEVYAALLKKQPGNADAMKRRVALAKARAGPEEAIKLLTEYLEAYAADTEAWAELAELYLSLSMYKQAAYCLEELLLSAPHDAAKHLRYAEVMYTLGGTENVLAARKYFAAAVELSGGHSVRALYGLCACAQALAGAKGHKLSLGEAKLYANAADRLRTLYAQVDSKHETLLAGALEAMGVYAEPSARAQESDTASELTS